MEVDGILKKKSLNKNLRLKVLTASVVNYFKTSRKKSHVSIYKGNVLCLVRCTFCLLFLMFDLSFQKLCFQNLKKL